MPQVPHIRHATWMGYDDFDVIRLAGIEKQDSLAVYCGVGNCSERITENCAARMYYCRQCPWRYV